MLLSYSPWQNNQLTDRVGVGVSILHKTIIGSSGQVQCNVSQLRGPVEQLGHQGKAGSLVSLGPAGNWLEARLKLFSCSSSDNSSFTSTFTFTGFTPVCVRICCFR